MKLSHLLRAALVICAAAQLPAQSLAPAAAKGAADMTVALENIPNADDVLPMAEVQDVISRYGEKLGRYIGPCDHLEQNPFLEWKDFSADLMKCKYKVNERKGRKGPITGKKTATAILMDASTDVLAKWVVASCLIVKHSAASTCTTPLMNWVLNASNAHFVVAGIVLEDQVPCPDNQPCGDGKIESYNFRDGVAVSIKNGIKNFSTVQASQAQIDLALDPNAKITAAHKYARIQSTCREHYLLYEKDLNRTAEAVKGLHWLGVVRTLYQDAWKRAHDPALPETVAKYRNDLMIAWEMEHVKVPQKKCA